MLELISKFHGGAILVASLCAFVAGAVWYGSLSKTWRRALGWDDAFCAAHKPAPAPFITVFVAELVMGAFFAGAQYHVLGFGLENGLKLACVAWFFLIMPAMLANNMFQHKKLMVSVIDGGHWLLVLLILGAVVGAWV